MTTDPLSAELDQPSPTTAPRIRGRIRTRQLIIGLVALIVLAVLARFGYTYYIDSTLYVTTDDALVDSNLVSVAPIGSGTLAIWRIKPGDKVRAGQVLGQVKPVSGSAYLNITAPIDGTILRVDGREGQVVAQAHASSFALIPSTDRSNGNFTKVTQRIEIHIDIGSTSGTALYPGENAYVRIRTA